MGEKLTAEQILKVVLREMTAIADGWRFDWSDFDGRTLQHQLERLETWAESNTTEEYKRGTEFREEQEKG